MFDKNKRKEIKRKIILFIVPKLMLVVVWVLYATCRNRFHIHNDFRKENAIIAFWHGELLMLPFLYRKIRTIPNIFVIISEHFDGELIATLQGYFGFKTIRGSKSKSGTRVLIQALSKLNKGSDVAITPDGPRGPYHSVADGIVAIAQKTGVNIVVFHTIPSRYWELKTWDRFRIPKPFSRIDYYAMSGFKIDQNMDKESAKKIIYEKMTVSPQ